MGTVSSRGTTPNRYGPVPASVPVPRAAGSSQPPQAPPGQLPQLEAARRRQSCLAGPPSLPMVLLPGFDSPLHGHATHPAESFWGPCLARQNPGGICSPPKSKWLGQHGDGTALCPLTPLKEGWDYFFQAVLSERS